jgi:hypothetical protein
MNAHPPLSARTLSAPDDAAPAPAGEGAGPAGRQARHLDMLDRLAELGMALAESVGREVAAGPPATEAAEAQARPTQFHTDLALAFSRASRAVRDSIALYDRITVPHACRPARAAHAVEASPEPDDELDELDHEEAEIQRFCDELARQVRAAGADAAAVQQRVAEARARLEDREATPSLFDRRFNALVDHLRRTHGRPAPAEAPPPQPPPDPEAVREAEEKAEAEAARRAAYRAGEAEMREIEYCTALFNHNSLRAEGLNPGPPPRRDWP